MKLKYTIFVASLLSMVAANAATITWTSALAPVTGDTLDTGLFTTTGIQKLAENVGAGAVSFDGINFTDGSKGTGIVNFFANDTGPLLNPSGTALAQTAQYGQNGTTGTVTLNVTDGNTYRIQLLVADGRGSSVGRALQVDGQNMGVYGNGVDGVSWGPAMLVTGTFVADASTQAFTTAVFLTDSYTTNKGQTLNAITLYEVIPEPSSAALLGLGGLALILRRRK